MHHMMGRIYAVCRRKPRDVRDCGVAFDGKNAALELDGRSVKAPLWRDPTPKA